jgi:hypothetical protein
MLYFSLLLLSCFQQLEAHPLSYTITASPYLVSTYFEMYGDNRYEGRVIKNHINVRTAYDLYDPMGNYQAQGICQVLSLGFFYAWAKDIDIYDAQGERIGLIEGQLLTTTSAKYSFYNQDDELLADAYLDCKSSGFTVMTPDGRTIAKLKRQFIQDDIDPWEVVIYETHLLDKRIFRIFSAFAIDFQEHFKEDN